ncbi:MAG: SRPBCC family protein [Nocardioides sp.]
MELAHRFTVPTGVEETWAHFEDVASVAECFPGAAITSVEDDTFAGTVKVKLGPIALVYSGSGTFVEKDEAAHKFVVDAKGKDKRGNGTAGAKVTLTMNASAAETGSTDVEVLTDLAITGKPAQFGRGVMQDVSDKLLGQFVSCLESRLTGPGEDAEEPVAKAVEPTATPGAVATSPVEAVDPVTRVAAGTPAASPPPARPVAAAPAAKPMPQDDSLDLGATVIPILLKAYWKPIAGVVAVVGLLIWWLAARD